MTSAHERPQRARSSPWVWVGLALILAVSTFLRFYRLESISPGLHTDEAFYGLDALRVWADGERPIFFEQNNGREPLFIYLLALAFATLGPSPVTMHIVSALLGTLTIPAVFTLARETFSDAESSVADVVALFSALALATLYWHVHYSRLALRAISMPLGVALVLWLFWRAIRLGRARDYLWAGLALGISMYTYLAARLLAPLLIVLLILLVVEKRLSLQARWKSVALLFGVALLVSLPLWAYFAQHPGHFFMRVEQIMVQNEAGGADGSVGLWTNIGRTLLMFTSAGDPGWPDNIPGRPVLDSVGIIGFVLGLGVVLWRFRRTRYLQWLICLALMITPTALTNYAPTYTRSIGATVPLALLLGVGFGSLWDWLRHRWKRPAASWILAAMLLLGAGTYSAGITYRDYFLFWTQRPEVRETFDANMKIAAETITSQPAGSDIYVVFATPDSYETTLDFLVQLARFARPPAQPKDYRLRWHNAECLVVPARTGAGLAYLLPPDAEQAVGLLRAAFPGGQLGEAAIGLTGEPFYQAFAIPGQTAAGALLPPFESPTGFHFGDGVVLLGGVSSAQIASAGDTLQLETYWQVETAPDRDYTIFIQLLGAQMNAAGNPVWGQRDTMPCSGTFPTTAWEAGTILVTRQSVSVASDAPAGRYGLYIGMYDSSTGERMAVRDAAGQAVPNNSVLLLTVEVH